MNAEVKKYADKNTKKFFDLKCRLMLPGFIDGYIHIL